MATSYTLSWCFPNLANRNSQGVYKNTGSCPWPDSIIQKLWGGDLEFGDPGCNYIWEARIQANTHATLNDACVFSQFQTISLWGRR